MEKAKGKTFANLCMKLFWIFLIGSVFGYVAEMLYSLVYTRTLVFRQGLLYGPFVQVYGFGAIAYYLLVSKIREPKQVFFAGMLMGGVLEYLCSFFQEIFFGTISWDYSNLFLNINGRTCLLYCLYWGIIGVVFLKVFFPFFEKIDIIWERKKGKWLTGILFIFLLFDVVISCMAATRQDERRKHISPKNAVDVFLDETYPDEFMDRIYNNKINIR